MTELAKNIQNQPGELIKSLNYSLGAGYDNLKRAADLVRNAKHVFITGIGSSWHAGMAVQSIFDAAGHPVHLVDASELIHFVQIPADSAVIALSRSGKSVEIVRLLDLAKQAGMKVIGVTNTPESPLAKQADVMLPMSAAFDHAVSITMYSALTLVGGLTATLATGGDPMALKASLENALKQAGTMLEGWRKQLSSSAWMTGEPPTYLLARGGSLSSCYETRLLWEEVAKAPACSMTTGGFRHGPQEVASGKLRVAMWIDAGKLRTQDLSLAADLRGRGVKMLLVGQNLPQDSADLVFNVPATPPGWQFIVDIMPTQIASEIFAHQRKMNPDAFLICPYIIESEGGLVGTKA